MSLNERNAHHVRQFLPSIVARMKRYARMYSAFFHRKSAKVGKSVKLSPKFKRKRTTPSNTFRIRNDIAIT